MGEAKKRAAWVAAGNKDWGVVNFRKKHAAKMRIVVKQKELHPRAKLRRGMRTTGHIGGQLRLRRQDERARLLNEMAERRKLPGRAHIRDACADIYVTYEETAEERAAMRTTRKIARKVIRALGGVVGP